MGCPRKNRYNHHNRPKAKKQGSPAETDRIAVVEQDHTELPRLDFSKPCRKGRATKGRRADGNRPVHRGARVIIPPAESRPWAARVWAFTPPTAITTPLTNCVLRESTITPSMRRVVMAAYFLETMDAPPVHPDSETTAWISKELKVPRGSTKSILNVIADTRQCAKDGVKYNGKKNHSPRTMLAAIPLDSPAGRIVAEAMEDGNGIRRAHADVMDWLRRRHDRGEPNVP